jgi:Ulp1 family protease
MWMLSTLFYQKLTSRGVTSGEDGWHNVSRWAQFREGGVLRRQYIFLPINVQNKHWWLAVVCFPVAAFAGNPARRSKVTPRIVFLDPLSSGTNLGPGLEKVPHAAAAGFLRGYLWREWCERENQDVSSQSAMARKTELPKNLKVVVADVPKQTNGYDCGIFIIEYLLHIFTSNSALSALGLAPHKHWFLQEVVSHRRRRLRWIAAMLQSEAKRRGTPDVGHLLQDDQLKRTLSPAFTDKPPAKRFKAGSHGSTSSA